MYVYAPAMETTAPTMFVVWLLAGDKENFYCCGTVCIWGYQ